MRLHAREKLLHIVAAADLELAGELAVDRVLDDDIEHGAAVVDEDVELLSGLRERVAAGDRARDAVRRPRQHVAARGGGDLGAAGAQQRNVAHDDLAADVLLGGEE